MASRNSRPTLYNQLGILPAADRRELRHSGRFALHAAKVDALEITSLWQSIVYGLGSGLGWWLAIVMMAAIREKRPTRRFPLHSGVPVSHSSSRV